MRNSFCVIVGFVAAALLAGCSAETSFVAKNEPWRRDVEMACLRSGMVREGAFTHIRSGLGGDSQCGAVQPFTVQAGLGGAVSFAPPAVLRCPMVPVVDDWLARVVQPAARTHLGGTVVEITVAASYSCRPRNHVSGARLSEHGYANALDVSAFKLTDGRKVAVKSGWRGRSDEQAFLRAVHDGACERFNTVLGPNADRHHHDHFHMDLARHGRSGKYRVCQ